MGKQIKTTQQIENRNKNYKPYNSMLSGHPILCDKLNVRKEPNINSDILYQIDKSETVTVDQDKSTDDFYYVITKTGIEGYAIKTNFHTSFSEHQ